MKYTLAWLLDKYQTGEKIKYLFFWGHQPTLDGSISESCFSQWWQSPFVVEGVVYKTAEHWMMAQKARLFDDQEHLKRIIACASPAEAKKIGRLVENFDTALWDKHKYTFVKEGNFYKFSQHLPLQKFLLNTGERVLVEASPVDTIWGIGMAKSNQNVDNPLHWKGENLLGFALMEVRDQLNTGIIR
jgi:ribA/ribD-fused uncharacterized protein